MDQFPSQGLDLVWNVSCSGNGFSIKLYELLDVSPEALSTQYIIISTMDHFLPCMWHAYTQSCVNSPC